MPASSDSVVLKLEHVDLIYHSAESLSFKRLLGLGGQNVVNEYKALNDVSINIEKGKVYGIIGSNGAGKSTLLRVLSGVMSPNSGTVYRNYRTINLLALGIGFSKELSGIDNIYLNGMLLGFTKKQIAAVLDEIVSYSELNDFIHRAMKTYSSGMVSRLGFSVAIHLRPEVLLIDEVLSVGDAQFREKSFNSIHKIIRDKDTTVVIVSHSMGQLEAICDNVIWLEKGRVITQGNRLEVLDLYSQHNQGKLRLEDIASNIGSVTIEDNGGFAVDAKNYNVRMPDSLERYFLDVPVDYIKEYTSAAGSLRLTKRQLFNKDYFLYFEYAGHSTGLSIIIDKVLDVASCDHLYQKPPFDNRYGENKLTGLYAYLDLAVGSIIVSKVYYYKRLNHKYNNGASTVYEFIRESDAVSLNENSVMNVSLDCNTQESVLFYVLISKNKIFRDKDNLGRYLEYYYKALYNNSVWNSFFTSPEGTFTKLPYSIEPFTKDGYGYSLHHSSRKDLIPFYNQTKERFFEDFILNAVFQAYLYQPRENGMFLTAYTSTWLKKDIGFTAPYIDTRLNETFILMLQDFQTAGPYFHELEPIREYADFFSDKAEEIGQTYRLEDGIFFPDYFKSGVNTLAHTSLNHQLGILLMMLKAWKKYNDPRYIRVLKSMLKFVELTCDNWRKDNGDLYYSIRINSDGKFIFYDNDYIYVTLIDLLLAQDACIAEKNIGRLAAFDSLIKNKVSYLKTTEYDIFSRQPANAPGEGIDSAISALLLYNKLYKNLEE